jgi:hypothetical protein
VRCKKCSSEHTVKAGLTRGKQRYLCKDCKCRFQLQQAKKQSNKEQNKLIQTEPIAKELTPLMRDMLLHSKAGVTIRSLDGYCIAVLKLLKQKGMVGRKWFYKPCNDYLRGCVWRLKVWRLVTVYKKHGKHTWYYQLTHWGAYVLSVYDQLYPSTHHNRPVCSVS